MDHIPQPSGPRTLHHEVKIRAWIYGPKTLPRRDKTLPHRHRSFGPGSWAQDITSKIEVKIRAWIFGPKTLPRRHGLYLKGTDLYLDF